MIRTVIFDLGGVIVPLDFATGYREFSACSGIPAEQVAERIRSTGLVPAFESGQMEADEFTRRLCEELGVTISEQDFRRIWTSIFPSHTLIPESLLAGIRKHHRLLLLSNTNSIHFEMIRENYPLLDHFDDYVLSYRVGAMKPSPLIYQAAIERAGCRPEECFFTDDIAAYVEGARSFGIDAAQFLGHDQLLGELRRRGIRWTD